MYASPDYLNRLWQETNRPSFVHVASWVGHGTDASLNPQSIPGLVDGEWANARVWQYAGAFNNQPCQVLGVDVDIDAANMPLAPAPGQSVAGHLIKACALKPEPNHTSPALVQAPAGGKILVLPGQATTNGEVWQRVQWTDKTGWVLASNVGTP